MYDNRVIRQEGEKTFPAYSIKQGKRKGQPDPPAKQQTDHPTKGCFIPSADITPRQSLACIGKTIHDIGKERKQLHQQRINSQNDITLFCTRRSKKCSNRHQTKRTKENIAIHLEEATHSDLIHDLMPANTNIQPLPIKYEPQEYSHPEASILSDQRSRRNPLHLHAEHKDEDQARHDIHDILGDRNKHRETGILHSDKPSLETIHRQYSRSPPNTHPEIGDGILFYLRAGIQ